jgi:hypothetical protein
MEAQTKLPSAKEYMEAIGVKSLAKLTPEYVGRWVPVKEALPPERMGVLVTENDMDGPSFAWLKYAAGDPYSPFFVCSDGASREPRGNAPQICYTHWFSPTLEGLPVVTQGIHSDVGITSVGWWPSSDVTRQKWEEIRKRHSYNSLAAEAEWKSGYAAHLERYAKKAAGIASR